MERQTSQLIEIIRNTKTLEEGVLIYQNASISLRQVDPNEIFPTANYVLIVNLERLFNTWLNHAKLDCDIFALTKLARIGEYVIAPPVVEWSEVDQKPLVVDGIHRFWLARRFHQPINTIYVEGARPDYPVISFPLAWNETVYTHPGPLLLSFVLIL